LELRVVFGLIYFVSCGDNRWGSLDLIGFRIGSVNENKTSREEKALAD
jgi:hypothetical protein